MEKRSIVYAVILLFGKHTAKSELHVSSNSSKENQDSIFWFLFCCLVSYSLFVTPYLTFSYSEFFPRLVVSVVVLVSSFIYHWEGLSFKTLKDALRVGKTNLESDRKSLAGSLAAGVSLIVWLAVMLFYGYEISVYLILFSLFMMLVAIFCYIVDSNFYARIFSSTSTKILVGFFFSCLAIYSKYIAFLSINEITGLSPELFPFAILIMTSVIIFLIFSIFNVVVLLPLSILKVISFFRKKSSRTYVKLLFSFCVLMQSAVFGSLFVVFVYENNEGNLPLSSYMRTYLVERSKEFHPMKVIGLDMSSNYPCENEFLTMPSESRRPVIFVGNSLDYIAYEENGELVISECKLAN